MRRAAILEYLESDGAIKVTDLGDALKTSLVTIRKDLDELEREGLLRRVHGGAIKNYTSQYNASFADRRNLKKPEKKRIAAATADLVSEGDSVIISAGSTCSYVCEALKTKENLIVITNSLSHFNDLAFCHNITTFFLGGRFDSDMQITVGDDVNDQLTKYTADKLIMGIDGIDIHGGATSYNHVEDFIMRQMILQAKRRILIADDSKIGKVTFAHIADITAFDTIVTNCTKENEKVLREIERLGIRVITV